MGPGCEKKNNLGDLTVKVRTERHGGGDIPSPSDFPRSQGPQAFACSARSDDKGNIVVFDGSGSFMLPNSCAGVASVSKVITGVQGRIPLHAKSGVFVLRTWEPEDRPSTDFSRR